MIDIYTKVVLTLIAAALAVLAFQALTPTATAQGTQCSRSNPCPVFLMSREDRFDDYEECFFMESCLYVRVED